MRASKTQIVVGGTVVAALVGVGLYALFKKKPAALAAGGGGTPVTSKAPGGGGGGSPITSKSPGSIQPGGGRVVSGGAAPIILGVWKRATSVQAGQTVRASLAATDVTALAASFGAQSAAIEWSSLIGSLGTQVQTWSPAASFMSPLPSDWPSDDPDPVNEYHAQFVSKTALNLPLLLLPRAMFWTQQ